MSSLSCPYCHLKSFLSILFVSFFISLREKTYFLYFCPPSQYFVIFLMEQSLSSKSLVSAICCQFFSILIKLLICHFLKMPFTQIGLLSLHLIVPSLLKSSTKRSVLTTPISVALHRFLAPRNSSSTLSAPTS